MKQRPSFGEAEVAEMWLPVDFAEPFGAQDPAGAQMMFGSLPRLLQGLEDVSERTLYLDRTALADAMREGPSSGGTSTRW